VQDSRRRSPALEPHAFGIVGAWQPSDRWTFSAKWKDAAGRPTDAFVVHSDVLEDAGPLRYSKELARTIGLRAEYSWTRGE
jgi:hypothetical protein